MVEVFFEFKREKVDTQIVTVEFEVQEQEEKTKIKQEVKSK